MVEFLFSVWLFYFLLIVIVLLYTRATIRSRLLVMLEQQDAR